MSDLYIKGELLKIVFKHNQNTSYFIYQFMLSNNEDLKQIISIFSRDKIDIEENKIVNLPILVSLNNGEIVYEFKRVNNG